MTQGLVNFSKEISINQNKTDAYNTVKGIVGIPKFSIISGNDVLNKIILGFDNKKIEVSISSVDANSSKLLIMIAGNDNNYYRTSDVATNIALNFENALTATIENKQQDFKEVPLKTDSVGCAMQIILLIVSVGMIIFALSVFV